MVYNHYRAKLMELWKKLYRGADVKRINWEVDKVVGRIDASYHDKLELTAEELTKLIEVIHGIKSDIHDGCDTGTYTEEELDRIFR